MDTRKRLSPQERKELWRRWKAGETLREIGAALGRDNSSVHEYIKHHGGIQPPERFRSAKHLTAEEREEISRGLVAGLSVSEIGRRLGRNRSTISREIERNGGAQHYRAASAERAAWQRARRAKQCVLARNHALRAVVARKLRAHWSPQQIAGWLRREYENAPSMQVSHETIYRTLFVQARGALQKELLAHLRSKRQIRRTASLKPDRRGQIVDAVPISERPPEIQDRAVPGHWEGDLVAGARNSHVATLVERSSRLTLVLKLAGKDSTSVLKAVKAQIRRLPPQLRRSLTWDRGCEMAKHKDLSIATDIEVYFCDPRSPWQKGTNENTNGLLRQYLPRTMDLSTLTQRQLDAIALKLNSRPRKTLEYETPAERFAASVALTG